ncbi:Yippee/Mis18 [Limtongia smithiae]|uniref:Yippee/Mis18 n=1 Tax=Limtongia smithiae TaxID=1125753 RepID=UPI0034CD64B3
MGLRYNVYLDDYNIYACKVCNTHLSRHNDIASRNFHGQHGKAFLFNTVVNVTLSAPEKRSMTTGEHKVCDIYCRQCGTCVGWRYEKAYEQAERYKEGKFILEIELIVHRK